jgi:hypothetical protein
LDNHLRNLSRCLYCGGLEEKPMNVRKTVVGSVVGVGLLAGSLILAQPARNVSPARHPNLAAAQDLTNRAYNRIVAAQQANEWDMDGHAQKAKDLLDQANRELKAAAEAANRH